MKNTATHFVAARVANIYMIDFMEASILDQVTIERIKDDLLKLADKAGQPKFILNFENVRHISSAMMGALIVLNKKVNEAGGEIRLASISPSIMQAFKLTRLDKVLKIYPDPDKALEKF